MSSVTSSDQHVLSANVRRNSDKPHVSIDLSRQRDEENKPKAQSEGDWRLEIHSSSYKINEPKTKADKPNSIRLFGVDLNHYSKTVQFCSLSLGIFFFYLLYGIAMEKIFRIPGLKPHGWYLTLVQFGIFAVLSKLELVQTGNLISREIPLKVYAIIALVQLGTIGFSNASLQYLNYPTQVIFKSCKLIPVLIGGILIQRKRKGMLDFVAAIVMSFGLAIFILADSQVSPNFDVIGIIMISTALAADAIIGNLQERVMKNHPTTSNAEFIHYSYLLGSIYLFVCLSISGNLMSGFQAFAKENLLFSYGIALIYSITGYLGVQVVLTMVRQFGAFTTVAVTSMRKALSIAISFLLFSKPFTINYVFGGLIVLSGIYLNLVAKDRQNADIVFKMCDMIINIVRGNKAKDATKSEAQKRIPIVI